MLRGRCMGVVSQGRLYPQDWRKLSEDSGASEVPIASSRRPRLFVIVYFRISIWFIKCGFLKTYHDAERGVDS